MACSWWCAAVAGWALLLGGAAARETLAQETAAAPSPRELVIRAHRARAQWNDFPGFEADVVLLAESKRVRRKLTVTPQLELKWNQPLPPELAGAGRRLLSVVRHRKADGNQEYDVELVQEQGRHPLGRLVRFHNDAMHSQYRIRGDVITQVSRQSQRGSFTITVLQVSRNAEKKYLPRVYTISFFGKTPQGIPVVRSTSVVTLDWERVGRWDLPRRIRSVNSSASGVTVEVIRLRNHRLLPPPP